jgi:hypothetical protein
MRSWFERDNAPRVRLPDAISERVEPASGGRGTGRVAGVRQPGRVVDAAAPVRDSQRRPEALGILLTQNTAPLSLGAVLLDDDREVHGFLCESYATEEAIDISSHGSWLCYLRSHAIT